MIKPSPPADQDDAAQDEPLLPITPSPDFVWQQPWTWLQVAAAALGSPRAFFRGLAQAEGLTPPLVFILTTQLLSTLGPLVAKGQANPISLVVMSLVWGLAQALFMAVVIFLVARRIMKSSIRLDQTLRAFAYGGAIWALYFVAQLLPGAFSALFLALMLGVHFYLMMVGLVEMGRISMPLAAACQIIAMVALFLMLLLINQLGSPALA